MPGLVLIVRTRFKILPVEPAQIIPVGTSVVVMAGAELPTAGDIPGAPGPASPGGSGGQPFLPLGQAGNRGACIGHNVRLPVERPDTTIPGDSAYRKMPGMALRDRGGSRRRRGGDGAPIRANQTANLPATRFGGYRELGGVSADLNPLNPLSPPPFLFRKLKDAVDADAGNPGFPVGQPALLGCQKAAENAAFPGIDGIVPLVAVFPGFPGFSLAESIGLVNAAVEGFAPVLGQGFQDGGRTVGVGKGLPVGAVPGDGTGLRRGCPPPPLRR